MYLRTIKIDSLIPLSLGKKQACSVRGLVPTFSTPNTIKWTVLKVFKTAVFRNVVPEFQILPDNDCHC